MVVFMIELSPPWVELDTSGGLRLTWLCGFSIGRRWVCRLGTRRAGCRNLQNGRELGLFGMPALDVSAKWTTRFMNDWFIGG